MYAVIVAGGKQYRVKPGDIIQIEKLEGEVGTSVKFDQVLMASKPDGDKAQIWLGKPLLSGAGVEGEIVGQGRGEKILIIKMKRRKQYRRTQGHRQYYTQILVTGLTNGAGETANLAGEQKKATLSKFYSQLKPKGLAMTPKTLGSRKRLAEKARAAAKPNAEASTSVKTSRTASKKTTTKSAKV